MRSSRSSPNITQRRLARANDTSHSTTHARFIGGQRFHDARAAGGGQLAHRISCRYPDLMSREERLPARDRDGIHFGGLTTVRPNGQLPGSRQTVRNPAKGEKMKCGQSLLPAQRGEVYFGLFIPRRRGPKSLKRSADTLIANSRPMRGSRAGTLRPTRRVPRPAPDLGCE